MTQAEAEAYAHEQWGHDGFAAELPFAELPDEIQARYFKLTRRSRRPESICAVGMRTPDRLIFLQGPDAPDCTFFGVGETWEEAFYLAAKFQQEPTPTLRAMKAGVPPRPKKKPTLH